VIVKASFVEKDLGFPLADAYYVMPDELFNNEVLFKTWLCIIRHNYDTETHSTSRVHYRVIKPVDYATGILTPARIAAGFDTIEKVLAASPEDLAAVKEN
jgi:hypothetical protein